jgi:hypothetical protein
VPGAWPNDGQFRGGGFLHYCVGDWLTALAAGRSAAIDVSSSPTLQDRGLWTWFQCCYDPYAYIDWASEWKLNTITFFHLPRMQ